MRYQPIDRDPEDGRLGRFIPDDWGHVDKYPLSALPPDKRPTQVPVVIGVNWYAEMFTPELDDEIGEHFVARAEHPLEEPELLREQLVNALVGRVVSIEEVDDQHVVLLPVTVAAPNPLLDALRIPREVVVHDDRTVLKVLPLA